MQSRSVLCRDHLLQTPDSFIRAPLPGMSKSTAIVHAGPAVGAAFTAYTAEMETEGELGPAIGQRFLYVIEGSIDVGFGELAPGGYAFFASWETHAVHAKAASRIFVIEKPLVPLPGTATPVSFADTESDIASTPILGDADVQVKALLPDDPSMDFAVNLLSFQPGASLPLVEMHVMEHGLLMLEGGGIYKLSDRWYPVTAGDFIWMAPFCPQWFAAVGKTPAKYLIYKDWNRHPAS